MSGNLYCVVHNGVVMSTPSLEHAAYIKKHQLARIYGDDLEVVPTDKEVKAGFKFEAPPEVVEEKGCAGGGCTL